jgi:hypothetical protein
MQKKLKRRRAGSVEWIGTGTWANDRQDAGKAPAPPTWRSCKVPQLSKLSADALNLSSIQSTHEASHLIASFHLATMGGESHRNMPVPVVHGYPKLSDGPVGKQIHSIYESRLRQFFDGGQYREQSLIG